MDIKIFMDKINEIKKLKALLPDTFWNRRKIKKALRELDRMAKESALEQAEKMYNQIYEWYNELIDNNLV